METTALVASYTCQAYRRLSDLVRAGHHVEQLDNYQLAQLWELYCAIHLTGAHQRPFWLYSDVLPDFKERENMPHSDQGVDVCDCRDTIVQCKLRTGTLTWQELATFFGCQNTFSQGTGQRELRWPHMVVARNAESTLSRNLVGHMRGVTDWCVPREKVVQWLTELVANPPVLPIDEAFASVTLHDYQRDAVECVVSGLQQGRHVIVSLPTGTGKSVVMLHAMDPRHQYLVLVPRVVLMYQLQELASLLFPRMSVQCVGDGQHEVASGVMVTLCVYNSVDLVLPHMSQFVQVFVDEAHHVAVPEIYAPESDCCSVSTGHDDEQWSEDDATVGGSEQEDTDDAHDAVHPTFTTDVDMESGCELVAEKTYLAQIANLVHTKPMVFLSATIDDTALPEPLVFRRDVRTMIEQGFICDYAIHVPVFSGAATDVAVAKYLVAGYRSIIIYCPTRAAGMEFTAVMNEVQAGCAGYVDAQTPRGERNRVLTAFKHEELAFVVNVQVLVEGFDAPCTRGVCFMHVPQSDVKVVQVVGRALRTHPGKHLAHVLLPCLDKGDAVAASFFIRTVARTDSRVRQSCVAARVGGYVQIEHVCVEDGGVEADVDTQLSVHLTDIVYSSLGVVTLDDRWEEAYTAAVAWYAEHGAWPSQKENKLGWWCNNQRQWKKNGRLTTEREARLAATEGWWWQRDKNEAWERMYIAAVAWFKEHDKWPAKKSKIALEKRLNQWCDMQRQLGKRGKLTPERETRLSQTAGWWWAQKDDWEATYTVTMAWFEEHGAWPSGGSKDRTEKRLGKWCCEQRRWKKKGKLVADREARLAQTAGWWWQLDRDDWGTVYAQVVAWFEQRGKWPGNTSKDAAENRLSKWCCVQRFLKRKGKLVADRETRLTGTAGWWWELDRDDWDTVYDQVVAWFEQNSAWPSQASKDATEKRLGVWCDTQRQRKKKGQLLTQRASRLEETRGWWWEVYRDEWTTIYEQVVAWVAEKRAWPSTGSKDATEKRLGNWCSTQRARKKTGKLPTDREARLAAFDGWLWETDHTATWDAMYEQVVVWFAEHNARPNDASEKRLGKWCNMQRHLKKKGKLTAQREARLAAINGWWWEQRPAKRARLE